MRRRFEDEISGGGGSNRIVFDITSGNPKNISGDVNGKVIQRICSKWRRCMAAPDFSMESTFSPHTYICYLDDDSSYRWANKPATFLTHTGECGQFMVYKPRFYYSINRHTAGKVFIDISEEKVDPTYIESPESLIGAVSACMIGNKVCSYTGQQHTMASTYNGISPYLQNTGPGYQFIDWEQHCMIALMFCAKYGNRNCWEVLGKGGGIYQTGYTAGRGNKDTTPYDNTLVNFLGIEGAYGVGEEVIYYDTAVLARPGTWNIKRLGSNQFDTIYPYVDETSGYYISNMLFEATGKYLDFAPSMDGGEKNTCYCAYYAQGQEYKNYMLTRGGTGDKGSIFYLGSNTLNNKTPNLAYRLAFRGSITEVEDPEEFNKLVAV